MRFDAEEKRHILTKSLSGWQSKKQPPSTTKPAANKNKTKNTNSEKILETKIRC